ncbi:molecular chaperone [Enterobacter sp. CGMCC 5087]|uniref:fimbrial biogenesis chaperone n=1 Tax=Enterobacter sp. CGMCC 5087 TaxID=2183878 RepID=UPI000D683713|nr:molecular chaperone [Enterobacter sp. CGMCC 5087]PWI77119.1 molecular chaperone [Enterobacter sp. CGMCC 5087]
MSGPFSVIKSRVARWHSVTLTPTLNRGIAVALAGGLLCLSATGQAAEGSASGKGITIFPMLIHYDAEKAKSGTIVTVMNSTDKNYLLQSTVSAFDPSTGRIDATAGSVPPFVVLPPLGRINAGERTALRVRQVGGSLPVDRESASIISVTGIPPSDSAARTPGQAKVKAGTQVQIAVRMNMRLFYRPAGLAAPDIPKIASTLTFRAQKESLIVSNPTPYFVHFSSLTAGGMPAEEGALEAWIAPKSEQHFRFKARPAGAVLWKMNGDKNEYKATL